MKKFSCSCIEEQFKRPDQVFVGFDEKSVSSILCAYRPQGEGNAEKHQAGRKLLPHVRGQTGGRLNVLFVLPVILFKFRIIQ